MSDVDGADREAQRSIHRLLRSFRSPDSFGLVLVMIVVTYVLAVSVPGRWASSLVLLAQIVTVRVSLHTSRASSVLRTTSDVMLALAGLAAIGNLVFDSDDAVLAVVFLGSSMLAFIAPFSILREIIFRHTVDRETMLGVLSAYLFFGMAFAFTYRFIGHVQTEPFFGAGGEGTVPQDMFFSFVTLTTTGYGNLVPAASLGQSLAVLEALIGQLFLVTAVSKLVNAWRPVQRGGTAPTDEGGGPA
ncbi:MAG: potassium channel family protein [Ilumatobacteraceae bacterium]